jgi:uncharacterized membrane protein
MLHPSSAVFSRQKVYTISMIKKLLLIVLLGVSLPLFANAQIVDEHIDTYSVRVRINADSTLHISETIVYNFGTTEHHGIFRTIPVRYKARGGNYNLRLRNVSITDELGAKLQYTTSKVDNSIEYKIGDPDKYVTGIHTYVINYDVENAINFFADHDELYWNAIGTGWNVPINQSSVIVETPVAADKVQRTCYTGIAGSTDTTKCGITNEGNSIWYLTSNLSSNEAMTIVAGLPKGVLAEPTTEQKIIRIIRDNWIVILPFFVFFIMWKIWSKYGRDPRSKGTITAQYESPDSLTPIEAGTIVDNSVSKQDISAELIYLATRGYLHIDRIETKKLAVFNSHDYVLKKLKEPGEELIEPEKTLLNGIFNSGDEIRLSDLQKSITFGKAIRELKSQTIKRLVTNGYYPRNPLILRIVCVIIGGALCIWGSMVTAALFGTYGIVATVVSGLIIIIFGLLMPARTAKGVMARDHILGLKEYMSVAEKDRMQFHNAPEKNPQLFEKLLPFAIALGVYTAWAKQFEGIFNQNPSWYSDSSHAMFNAHLFSSSLNDFSSSVNGAVASSSTAASGGSGFSGGGGGGFGGGGGGSW